MGLNRRFVLTTAGSVTGAGFVSGCLSNIGLFGRCPAPDKEDGLGYEQMMSASNWFDDEFKDEPRQPHAILVTKEERASEVVSRIYAGDDEEAFVQGTDFSSAFLLVIQIQVLGQHEFDFNGVERVDNNTAKAFTCLTSRNGDQPAYDDVFSLFVRAPHGNIVPENVKIDHRDQT